MPVRRWLLLAVLVSGGCVPQHHQSPAKMPFAVDTKGWDGNANLALDQILPVPQLLHPATESTILPPIKAVILYGQARDATLRGQQQEAIGFLQQALTIDPGRFDLLNDLGWAYVQTAGSDENAISTFENAASIQPDHLGIQIQLGRLYLGRGDIRHAIEHLRLATQTTYYKSDDGKAAVADFFLARALKLAGYDRAALNQYSVLIMRFEHPTPSLQQNAELSYLLAQPDALFVEIGELLEKHGEYAAAIRSYRPQADREPDNFDLQARYARVLALDHRREAALDKAIDVVVRNRANQASLGVLRDVCRLLNLDDGTIRTLRKLHASRLNDRPIFFALVDTLLARHRSTEAQQLLESGWNLSPSDLTITRRLFETDKQNGAIVSAARVLIHALAVNSDAESIYRPLWMELLRPGLVYHLTLSKVIALKTPGDDESARQYFIAVTANDERRSEIERSALEESTRVLPAFAPGYRALLACIWDRSDLTDSERASAGDALASSAKTAGDPALAMEVKGHALLRQQKLPEAADVLTKAIALGGQSSQLKLAAIQSRRGEGRDTQYDQSLQRLISERPVFEDGYIALLQYDAQAYSGSVEQRLKLLSAWLAADPQSAEARLMQAELDMQLGQAADAERELNQLFEDDSDNPETFRVLRTFYNQAGRGNELIARFEEMRARNMRDTDLVGRLVLLYSDQARNAEALRLLEGTRAAVADDADLLYSLRRSYYALNQKPMVEELLHQIVLLAPNHAGACNDLGFLWADQGKELEKAEEMIRLAVKQEPDNALFLDSLGWVLYKRGRFEESRQNLQLAIHLTPMPNSALLDHLGDALYRLAKPLEAGAVWKLSLKDLGAVDESREDLKQLRLKLMQKIRQADENRPVDVAGITGQ